MASHATYGSVPHTHINTWSGLSGYRATRAFTSGLSVTASVANTTANRAIYFPVAIPWMFTIRRLFWGNGSSVGSSVDMGLFTQDFVKVASSGTTTTAGASTLQFVTLGSPVLIDPGFYYFGFVSSGTTNALMGASYTLQAGRLAGCKLQQLGSASLPAVATPSSFIACTIPLCGIASRTWGL